MELCDCWTACSWPDISCIAHYFSVCLPFLRLQFPQIPHYNLVEATEAAKKVMGPYYRCGTVLCAFFRSSTV